MEARESQREMMQLAALDEMAGSASSSSVASVPDESSRPFLDLALLRKQAHSTVTSLESLASSADLKEEPSDNNLKRNRNIISTVHKESQLKSNYRGAFPCGDVSKPASKPSPKRKCYQNADSASADDH